MGHYGFLSFNLHIPDAAVWKFSKRSCEVGFNRGASFRRYNQHKRKENRLKYYREKNAKSKMNR